MKHDLTDLSRAFPPEPESCHTALMQAARSVKEDEPVKKLTYRTILIAALIVAAMMAVAVAATGGGLTDWFQRAYHVTLPKSAQEVLIASEKTVLETDLITVTVNEFLCDGKIAYLTAEAQLKDGEKAILYPISGAPMERIGEQLAKMLDHPEVSAQSTYWDAAKATGLPLYQVRVEMELAEEYEALVTGGMGDGVWTENGTFMLVHMLYFQHPIDADALPVTVVCEVSRLDPDTMAYVESSQQRVTAEHTLPIYGVMAQQSYAPEEPAVAVRTLYANERRG